MSKHDEIIASVSLISIISFVLITELLNEWAPLAVIVIPVIAFIAGALLLRYKSEPSLEQIDLIAQKPSEQEEASDE